MIVCDGVDKVFTTRSGEAVHALAEIDMSIDRNEFVSLVGPSGCGKSTFLRLVAGLERPSNGSIYVDGNLVEGPYPGVGFVFQQPVLLPWRSVLENVLLSVEMQGLKDKGGHRKRALELLEMAGLSGFMKKYPAELSGGMQQRVSICRALVHNPDILLMDEPFGALDAMTREEMSIGLLAIWEELRKTIVFVTHSISEAVLLSDRVIVMSARPGRVARVLEVDVPRPRDMSTESDERFTRTAQTIREIIFAPGQGVGP